MFLADDIGGQTIIGVLFALRTIDTSMVMERKKTNKRYVIIACSKKKLVRAGTMARYES